MEYRAVMQIDVDPAKSERNDRGFGFPFAARICPGDTIERLDSRAD